MPQDPSQAPNEPLQLDVALPADAPTDASSPQTPDRPSVECAFCRKSLPDEYHHVANRVACADCRRAVEQHASVPTGPGVMARAIIFALGAAIAGAIVYYAVAEATGLEIGIVAIAIGYMVGWSVRRATGNRGGRRFQIVAAIFTYWSVGLAYTPIVFKSTSKPAKSDSAVVATDSARSSPAERTSDSAVKAPPGSDSHTQWNAVGATSSWRSLGIGVAIVLGFAFALPVMAVFGSLPSGLITGIIVYVGLSQAWRMTAAPNVKTSGPYRVGGATP